MFSSTKSQGTVFTPWSLLKTYSSHRDIHLPSVTENAYTSTETGGILWSMKHCLHGWWEDDGRTYSIWKRVCFKADQDQAFLHAPFAWLSFSKIALPITWVNKDSTLAFSSVCKYNYRVPSPAPLAVHFTTSHSGTPILSHLLPCHLLHCDFPFSNSFAE